MATQTVTATITLEAQDREHAERTIEGLLARYNATVVFADDSDSDDDSDDEPEGDRG